MQSSVEFEEFRPRLRGVMHAWAFWFALAAGVVLIVMAPDATARIAAAIYSVGLCALFGGSGLYHRWRWNPRWRPLLRRIDHSTIFLFIAASATPPALLVLEGTLQITVLACVWFGAAAGIAFTLFWIEAPRWLVAGSYLLVGWMGVLGVPQFIDRLPLVPLLLLAVGGVLYTVGAVIYAARRPDPWPRVFGFHEVFHTLVVLAAIAHFVAMAGWVVPSS